MLKLPESRTIRIGDLLRPGKNDAAHSQFLLLLDEYLGVRRLRRRHGNDALFDGDDGRLGGCLNQEAGASSRRHRAGGIDDEATLTPKRLRRTPKRVANPGEANRQTQDGWNPDWGQSRL